VPEAELGAITTLAVATEFEIVGLGIAEYRPDVLKSCRPCCNGCHYSPTEEFIVQNRELIGNNRTDR
jgi:hypothetical protein